MLVGWQLVEGVGDERGDFLEAAVDFAAQHPVREVEVLERVVWREGSAEFKSAATMGLKEVARCLEVFEDEGVNRVRAEGAEDRRVAGFCGDLLQETSKDGERGWIVRLFLEDSKSKSVECFCQVMSR